MPRNQKAKEFRSKYRDDCPHFPNPLTLGFTAGGGEGYEVVNYSSWTRVAVGVTNVRRRTFSFRSRDGLLAQRRFRRERGVEWRTAARRTLRS